MTEHATAYVVLCKITILRRDDRWKSLKRTIGADARAGPPPISDPPVIGNAASTGFSKFIPYIRHAEPLTAVLNSSHLLTE